VARWEVIDAQPDPEPIVVVGAESRTIMRVVTAIEDSEGMLRLVNSIHLMTERDVARFYADVFPVPT
jgi:hypothetical protein